MFALNGNTSRISEEQTFNTRSPLIPPVHSNVTVADNQHTVCFLFHYAITCISILVIYGPYSISLQSCDNLEAIAVNTVCIGSVIFILMASYERIVCKMYFVSLHNSDYVTVIMFAVLISIPGPIKLHLHNFRLEEVAFFSCLFCSLTLNNRIKPIFLVHLVLS